MEIENEPKKEIIKKKLKLETEIKQKKVRRKRNLEILCNDWSFSNKIKSKKNKINN